MLHLFFSHGLNARSNNFLVFFVFFVFVFVEVFFRIFFVFVHRSFRDFNQVSQCLLGI